MLEIKVLGGGCSNCENTVRLLEEVAQRWGKDIHLEKIQDYQEILSYDVMSTPGVVIDGQVVHRGSVPSREMVERWLAED